jgi:4-azaleucine resistance transporter AzlC
MRSMWRTLDPAVRRSIALLCLADGLVGASLGALTVSAGLPWWFAALGSVVVFAGAAQFLLLAALTAGGSVIAGVTAALLVNLRLLPFAMTVADLYGDGRTRRLLGAHLVTDESVAMALAQPDRPRRRAAFWACGLALFAAWNLGVGIGVLGGARTADPRTLGLDAAFPAVLLALVVPALRDRGTRRAAALGALVAIGASFVLPAGVPVLLALLGMLAGGLLGGRRTSGGTRPAGPTATRT